MRTTRTVTAALAIVILCLIGGCGKPNPLAPSNTPYTPSPPDTTETCIMVETTVGSEPFQGNDTYLGSPGAESKIIDHVVFLPDSSSLDVRWRFTTSGGTPSTPFVFAVMAKKADGSGTPVSAWFDGGADKLYLYGRNVDTTVVAHFATDENVVIGGDYKIYAKWVGGTMAPASRYGDKSTLCHGAGTTQLLFRRWEEKCTTIIHD